MLGENKDPEAAGGGANLASVIPTNAGTSCEKPGCSPESENAELLEVCSKDQEVLPWLPPARSTLQRIFIIFDDGGASKCGKLVAVGVMLVIVVSTVSFVLESMPDFNSRPNACAELRAAALPGRRPALTVEACRPKPDESFFVVEAICIAMFTIDYVIRVGTSHTMPSSKNGCMASTISYVKQPLNVIDLLAILPFYTDLCIDGDVGPMRVLRLFRILRLFKMAKHHPGMRMFAEVMMMSWGPLSILAFFKVIMTVLFAALVFFAEGQTYSVADEFTMNITDDHNHTVPARFPNGVFVRTDSWGEIVETPFYSIPQAIWWVTVTMTTVGYGDFTVTTILGKMIGVPCFYVGIIFLALPISVLGTNFEIVYNRTVGNSSQTPSETSSDNKEKEPVSPVSPKRVREPPKNNLGLWLPEPQGFRRRFFLILEDPQACALAKHYSIFMISVILLSTTCFVLESMPAFHYTPVACRQGHLSVENCRPRPDAAFLSLEVVCITIFTIDFLCRVGFAHAATPEECGLSPSQSYTTLKITVLYALQGMNIVDFLAIAPFYFEQAGGGGGPAAVLRVLRLIRVFRVLKMPRMRACAEMFVNIVRDALPALMILFFMTSLTCVLFASLIVFAEGSWYSVDRPEFQDSHPDGLYIRPTADGYGIEPSPFRSILYAFWWFFTTATTVGYGDDYPTTTAGRLVGICAFYTGIILLALPITIVGGAFSKYYPDWLEEFGGSAEKAQSTLDASTKKADANLPERNEEVKVGPDEC